MNLENAELPESVTVNLLSIIQDVVDKSKLSEEVLLDIIQFRFESIIGADRKKFPTCVLYYNERVEELQVFIKKKVVNKVEDDLFEFPLQYCQYPSFSSAEDINLDNCKMVEIKFNLSSFTRMNIAVFRFFLSLNIKQEQQNLVYREYMFRVDKIITGVVQNKSSSGITINLGKITGMIYPKEQVKTEKFKLGERVASLIISARDSTPLEEDRKLFEKKYEPGEYQISLSRASVKFVVKLFEQQVPEIFEQIVFIERIIREAGSRTKIAVRSKDLDVDPVGACVGAKGTRITNIIHELRGEKIDIIPFERNQGRFVSNALSPARVNCVYTNRYMGIMEVNVPDSQLSLAIGRKGQNVRLASGLTGWRITVKQQSEVLKEKKNLKTLLKCLSTFNEIEVEILYENCYRTYKSLVDIGGDLLSKMLQISPARAEKINQNLVRIFYLNKIQNNPFFNLESNVMFNYDFIGKKNKLFLDSFYFTFKDILIDPPDLVSRHLNISKTMSKSVLNLIIKNKKVFCAN